jgi:hypothetical protein
MTCEHPGCTNPAVDEYYHGWPWPRFPGTNPAINPGHWLCDQHWDQDVADLKENLTAEQAQRITDELHDLTERMLNP